MKESRALIPFSTFPKILRAHQEHSSRSIWQPLDSVQKRWRKNVPKGGVRFNKWRIE